MRTRFFPFFFTFSTFFLFPLFLSASETRVAATGGLTTLVDDETTDLNLFLDGNPAGLLYLNTKDRFDLSGEWSATDQEGPWGSHKTVLLSTLSDPSANLPAYGGVMVFPDPHWAFQVTSQVLYQEGFPVTEIVGNAKTESHYVGVVRGAYALPFGVLGAEFSGAQKDKTYGQGGYDSNDEVLSGSSGEGTARLKLGMAATFPDHFTADQTRFRAGISWGSQLGAHDETRSYQMDQFGPPAFPVTQIWTTRDSMDWGGELTMEVPGVLKMMLDVHEKDTSVDMAQTIGAPVTLTPYGPAPPLRTGNLGVGWNFKWTLAGIETEDLKLGGGLSYLRDSTTSVNSIGEGVYQEFTTRLGLGLDSPRDHLMGLQWTGVHSVGGTDRYQVAFGGEKSIGPTWALRLGLTGEIDHAYGASHDDLDTVLDMGAGLEEAFGRVDLRLRLGQTVNMSDSDDIIGLFETQVSGTLFL